MDAASIGAALALTGNAAAKASNAANNANTAADRANLAADGAEAYAGQYNSIIKKDALDDADIRMLFSIFQAKCREYEKEIKSLKQKLASMVGA